jgi:hypothetical protein
METDLKGSDAIIVTTVPIQCFERVDAVTRVTRVTRMPRLLTLCYAQDVQRRMQANVSRGVAGAVFQRHRLRIHLIFIIIF